MSQIKITRPMAVVLSMLLLIGAGIVVVSIYLSTRRQLTALESLLLSLFLWASAIGIGVICSSIYSQKSALSSLEERAKPAIRRVSELLRASQKLHARLLRHPITSTTGPTGATDDSLLLFVDNHIGELRSAVQDWRELLPPDYVEDVIADDTTSPEPNSLSWKEFEKIYLDLAERSGKGALWGGYHPHFMVGVYPAGGMIGYLLWLQFGRRCPILVAPDPEAPQSTIEALATRVKALCPGQSQYRCLIVDASLKTGKSMATTKIMVQEMARSQDIDLEIRTLCLVEYPLQDKPVLSADFVGVRESVHLPFADA